MDTEAQPATEVRRRGAGKRGDGYRSTASGSGETAAAGLLTLRDTLTYLPLFVRRAKAKKGETKRLRDFVDAAWNCDPRVAAAHQEKKQAREDRKQAKIAEKRAAEEAKRKAKVRGATWAGGAACDVREVHLTAAVSVLAKRPPSAGAWPLGAAGGGGGEEEGGGRGACGGGGGGKGEAEGGEEGDAGTPCDGGQDVPRAEPSWGDGHRHALRIVLSRGAPGGSGDAVGGGSDVSGHRFLLCDVTQVARHWCIPKSARGPHHKGACAVAEAMTRRRGSRRSWRRWRRG